ncbi:MAG: hemolysin family protein [Acidimicrobiales bacterium]|jgi:CBS domain containing-hemolysin-like protein
MKLRPQARKLGRQPSAQVSEQEIQIRKGLESMREATAREVMTPRVDVVALEVPVTLDDVALAVRRSGHSHFPVFQDDLDHLIGVLFVKDLFHPGPLGIEGIRAVGRSGEGGSPVLDVAKRVREPYIVPESRLALEILAEMRRARRAFAVVVDEYGGVAGVLTVNDLVSELVGDLRDEFDRASLPAIERVDKSRFLVDGSCGVDEVRSELGIPIPDGDYVTLGGFLFEGFGRIPEEGDELDFEGWTFQVTRMDRRRVAKVVVQAPAATMSGQGGTEQPGATADGK